MEIIQGEVIGVSIHCQFDASGAAHGKPCMADLVQDFCLASKGNPISICVFHPRRVYTITSNSGLEIPHLTGGEGSITQWVHGECIVISEAIRSHFTHQAHGKHF